MVCFKSQDRKFATVAELEILVRIAVFRSANELIGWLLRQASNRINQAYPPNPGEVRNGRDIRGLLGIFGCFC